MLFTAIKLKNAFRKHNALIMCDLKAIRINGNTVGYSGFISYNDKHVYVNYEQRTHRINSGSVLYRTAAHPKEYTGGRNQFCRERDIVLAVSALLSGSN